MFAISKIISILLDPAFLFLLAMSAGTALLFTRRWRWGRAMLAGACSLAAILLVLPLSDWAIRPLEDRFPPPAYLPEKVDGIVVLGGAIDSAVTEARGQTALGEAAERVDALVELARRYPDAKLVYSGGSGSLSEPHLKEAHYAARHYAALGLDVSRVIFEDQSRNTRENAVFSAALAAPHPGEAWLLVTSAMHMPRSVGAFRAIGWQVIPYPVDYQMKGEGRKWSAAMTDLSSSLKLARGVLHEWLGLVYYRLRGWTDALLPGPRDRL